LGLQTKIVKNLASTGNILLLHNSAIDVVKWDESIHNAPNARNYAMSWYLDILHPDWHGLVYGNYRYVMPVVFSSKFGIRYAYQPVFAQQHGIFPPSTPDVTELFIDELKKHFRFFEISFNHYNLIHGEELIITKRKNYILSLYNDYPTLWQGFSQQAQRNIKKARKSVTISFHITLEEYLNLNKNWADRETKPWLSLLKQIIAHAFARKIGLLVGAYSEHNELCAAAFFIKEKGRYTYLSSVSSPQGKEHCAMFAVIDSFIHDHACQPLLLDFEGSMIEGIARFFAGFGAQPEIYQKVKYNRLPKIIRWLKK
jgi:hypothetical protein